MAQSKQLTKHTPGPWKAEGWLIVRDTKTRRLRFSIASVDADTWEEEIADGNVRLIAAAPEMYELLGKLLEGNGVCVHNQNPTEFPHTCYEPLICEEARRIKAAIDG